MEPAYYQTLLILGKLFFSLVLSVSFTTIHSSKELMLILPLSTVHPRYFEFGFVPKALFLTDCLIAESLVSQRRYDNLGEVDTR